jgi:hypothetical protein
MRNSFFDLQVKSINLEVQERHAVICAVFDVARLEEILEEKPPRSAFQNCIPTSSMHLKIMPGYRYGIATPLLGKTSTTRSLVKLKIGTSGPGSQK